MLGALSTFPHTQLASHPPQVIKLVPPCCCCLGSLRQLCAQPSVVMGTDSNLDCRLGMIDDDGRNLNGPNPWCVQLWVNSTVRLGGGPFT